MALQVWLPLIKDLTNYGLANVTVTSNAVTQSTTEGKLGTSYSFNGSTTWIKTTMPSTMKSLRNSSVCMWIKSTASVGAGGGIMHNDTNAYACMCLFTSGWQMATGSAWKYISTGTFANTSVWHHVACTMDDTKIRTYLDGVLVTETTIAAQSVLTDMTDKNFIGLGCDFPGGDEYFTGFINDFRVYDHCLSKKEVKEISKGLVLHYPLNQLTSISNVARNSTYSTYNNFTSVGATGSVSSTGRMYDGCTIYRLTFTPTADCLNHVQTTLHGHGIFGFRTTFLANTKYCFWILYKPISHPDTICGGTASNIGGFTEIPPAKYNDDWMIVGQYRNGTVTEDKTDNIFTSFKTPSATAGTPITIDFCCPHLVVGVQNILPEYDYQGNTPTVEYDTSGYMINGTRSNITYSSNTPRNSASTVFDGTSSGIEINSNIFPIVLNASFTVSMWVYDQETGGRSIFFGNYSLTGSFFNIEKEGNNKARFYWNGNPDFHCTNSPIASNTWTYLVMTRDGNTVKCYINGVLKDTSTTTLSGTIPTNATVFRLGRDGRSDATMFKGQMSDFRLYATVLSEADIKELYNQPISFNKHSTMTQGEFIEK